MNPTRIEWVQNPDGTQGFTCNSKTGCLNHTPEGLCLGGMFPCYAFKLAHGRLRHAYSLSPSSHWKINYDPAKRGYSEACIDPFYPKWWPKRLEQIRKHKKPAGVFLDDMSDWMGDYWPEEWTEQELQVMRDCPQHRFYTLTKQPQNLANWSPFPDNVYIGVTACKPSMFVDAIIGLRQIEAKVKYISFEPLLESIPINLISRYIKEVDWAIIGAQTKPYKPPKISWVQEIVEAADRGGVKLFLKNNLMPLFEAAGITRREDWTGIRQEMPK